MATAASRVLSVPRPRVRPAERPAPRLVCLSAADLEEIPAARPPSVPPPLPARRRCGSMPIARRPAGEPILGALFDKLVDLDAQPNALSAARVCLDALAAVLPCRALVAHAFDAKRQDFIVVHARGECAECMVLSRHPSTDPLLRVTMSAGEPFAWNDLRRAPVTRLTRFAELPGVKTILQAPVVAGMRWFGAFELVDPAGGAAFRTQDALGARYVASRYAQFLTVHGLVVDVGTIARFASA